MKRHKPLSRRTGLKSPLRPRREDKLWLALHEHAIARFGFQHRQRVGPFEADIVCPAAKLAILIEDAPSPRAEWLGAAGYRVLTLTRAEASNPAAALDAIAGMFELRIVPAAPARGL